MGDIRRNILLFAGAFALLVSPGCSGSDPSGYLGAGASFSPTSNNSPAPKRDVKPNIVIEDSAMEKHTLVFLVELNGDAVTVKEQRLTADVPTHFLDARAPLVVRLESLKGRVLFEGGLDDPAVAIYEKWDKDGKITGKESRMQGPVEFFLKIPKKAGAEKLVFYRTLYEVVPMDGGGMKLSPYGQRVIGSFEIHDF